MDFNCRHPSVGLVLLAKIAKVKHSIALSVLALDQMMEGRLRTSLQGADTIIWLAISKSVHTEQSGTLWFDRRIVAENFFPWTASSKEQEQQLWDTLEELRDALGELRNAQEARVISEMSKHEESSRIQRGSFSHLEKR